MSDWADSTDLPPLSADLPPPPSGGGASAGAGASASATGGASASATGGATRATTTNAPAPAKTSGYVPPHLRNRPAGGNAPSRGRGGSFGGASRRRARGVANADADVNVRAECARDDGRRVTMKTRWVVIRTREISCVRSRETRGIERARARRDARSVDSTSSAGDRACSRVGCKPSLEPRRREGNGRERRLHEGAGGEGEGEGDDETKRGD